MRAWTVMSLTEQAHELQALMGACDIGLYPSPLPRVLQQKLREAPALPEPNIEARRREVAALPASEFEKVFVEAMNPLRISEGLDLTAFGPKGGTHFAYGAALVDTSEPLPEYLRHFQKAGYEGQEAAFMARFLFQTLERMGEPERAEYEATVLGPDSEAEQRRKWYAYRDYEMRANPYEEIRRRRGRTLQDVMAKDAWPAFLRPPAVD